MTPFPFHDHVQNTHTQILQMLSAPGFTQGSNSPQPVWLSLFTQNSGVGKADGEGRYPCRAGDMEHSVLSGVSISPLLYLGSVILSCIGTDPSLPIAEFHFLSQSISSCFTTLLPVLEPHFLFQSLSSKMVLLLSCVNVWEGKWQTLFPL